MKFEDIVIALYLLFYYCKASKEIQYIENIKAVTELYKQAKKERHHGDCIAECNSCLKCQFNECEIMAENLIILLELKIK